MRLLDVGCGWGGMVRHAAREYGVEALGVTLSREQAAWAQAAIEREGLDDLAEVRYGDYRDVAETGFDAVSSIGLTEHIGVRNYPAYFALPARPARARRPAAQPLHHPRRQPHPEHRARSSTATSSPTASSPARDASSPTMQDAGLEVRHEENLREHYALTLAGWCRNLVEHWDECVAEVGDGHRPGVGPLHGRVAARLRAQRDPAAPGARRQAGADGNAHFPLRPTWLS